MICKKAIEIFSFVKISIIIIVLIFLFYIYSIIFINIFLFKINSFEDLRKETDIEQNKN